MIRKNGFTLIELIVVTLIIATLALLVAPSFKNSTLTNNMEKAKMGLIELNTAAKLYREVHPDRVNLLRGEFLGKKIEMLATQDEDEGYVYMQHTNNRWAENPHGTGYCLKGTRCLYWNGGLEDDIDTSVNCKFIDDDGNEECIKFFISKVNPAVIQKGEVSEDECTLL